MRQEIITAPFTEIADEEIGNRVYGNTVAVGALTFILGMKLSMLKQVLEKRFSKKSDDIIQNNLDAAEKGYSSLAEKNCKEMCQWTLSEREGRFYPVTGNVAIALAAAHAGCRFMAAYPMTPLYWYYYLSFKRAKAAWDLY